MSNCRFENDKQTTNALISNSLVPTIDYRNKSIFGPVKLKIGDSGASYEFVQKSKKRKKRPALSNEAFMQEITNSSIVMVLPLATVSEANCFESWRDKHKRHTIHKDYVSAKLRPHRNIFRIPCHITLTRFAPAFLDEHDNLRMSFKYILDRICAEITGDHRPGRADNNENITISYAQEKSKTYKVNLKIDFT